MTGTRVSLQVAVVVLGFAVVFGTVVGAISGYFGGIVDEILMRFTDMFLAFPALVLAIAIAATLGRELNNTMIALSTVFWPWYARLVRAQVLTRSGSETTSPPGGVSDSRRCACIFRHILPNADSVVIIQVTLDVGYAILATSSLSFIGLGAATAFPRMGHDDVDRPQLFPRRLVVHHLPRPRVDTDRLCLQRPRRRTPGRARSPFQPALVVRNRTRKRRPAAHGRRTVWWGWGK